MCEFNSTPQRSPLRGCSAALARIPFAISAADRPRLFNHRWCERSLALSSMCWPHGDHRTAHSRRNPAPFSTSSSHGRRMRRPSTLRIFWGSRHSPFPCVFSGNKSLLLASHDHPAPVNLPLLRPFFFPCHPLCPLAQIRPTSTPFPPASQSP